MHIEVRNLHKNFAGFPALVDVSLAIESGELIALLGPSGSGKTTLLRAIAGLEFPDQGQILFGGEDMARRPVRERNVGFVFQHYALFRHMTVLDNVGFGLSVRPRRQRPGNDLIRKRAQELLELVQLGGLGGRYPHQLSGGQKQRVALARALAIDPRVLLLDEPFGALDAKVRKDLRRWLRELHGKTGYTTVFVTHDQEEALELADRVVIMNRGRIEQVGTTDQVYEHPRTPFVFDFLGGANVIEAEVRGRQLTVPGGTQAFALDSIQPNGPVDLYVRPGDLRLAEASAPGIEVRVSAVHRAGPTVHVTAGLAAGGASVAIELPHLHHDAPSFVPGAQLRLRMMQFTLYPRGSGATRAAVPGLTPVGEHRERGRG
ncbi:MAG TPA: sulfate ABC transporter ATP-binding protein [Candidatus Binatia bacterium]|nr:sulfate ABC transporter ATP-binding protein [Candidatus Binatia bacterium]